MVFFKKFKVDAGLEVHSFRKSDGRKPAHILVAGLVLAKKNQVKVFSVLAVSSVWNKVLFLVASVGYIKFFAYNRIYSIDVAELFKVECAEHVAVVCEGKGAHVHGFCLCYKGVNF